MKGLSFEGHQALANVLYAALMRPLRYESGNASMEFYIVERVWTSVYSSLNNEVDIRLYLPFIERVQLVDQFLVTNHDAAA
jgi:hypothetical protein